MSERAIWKMLHTLYTHYAPTLSTEQLAAVGVNCYEDTIAHLVASGTVTFDQGAYRLSDAARALLQFCLLARRGGGPDVRVDYPHAFVVMPFNEPWSDQVYREMFDLAIREAGFEGSRGDTIVRVGDLTTNIWAEILRTGVVLADVSVPNVNVFYEIGLTHALGKDVLLFKQRGKPVPADFGGTHYYEYELTDLEAGRRLVQSQLEQWSAKPEVRAMAVKALSRS